MSLVKRLWISVVLAMAVVLVGAFAVSLLTARSYFEQQLQAQSGDGAVSLALSMSQQTKDAATMELLVTALFDGGHYRSIRFVDSSGKIKIEQFQALQQTLSKTGFEGDLADIDRLEIIRTWKFAQGDRLSSN